MRSEMLKMYADDMTRLHHYLARLDPNEHASWAHVAKDTAGACAAWFRRLESTPGHSPTPHAPSRPRVADPRLRE
ncbi:hypothetical protein GW571_14925 (plasmid) [Clavibacter capsici]|uniref:hypothetical protein n=1 Tax=Clavibacter capsici TaxID=1874630 RepID=UPI0006B1A68A|nr:hypothetical protein [Clavibacter capsici]QIS40543.1 hypothetical protein GW572_15300 [Clavibacter capsici]QIS43526.1 hypothetical protein GW571_14925 [Clavibacter capsici]